VNNNQQQPWKPDNIYTDSNFMTMWIQAYNVQLLYTVHSSDFGKSLEMFSDNGITLIQVHVMIHLAWKWWHFMSTDVVMYSMDGQLELSKYKLEYDACALCLNILSPSRIYSSENRIPFDHIWWLYYDRMFPQLISNCAFKKCHFTRCYLSSVFGSH
jgi:hypothetical protein